MKLVIQIPCYNEEQDLPETLEQLPRTVPGFDEVEWLVIDDGSHDRTVEVAIAHGVDRVVSMPAHQGLARSFMAGLKASLELDADVIVNTDADNQYNAGDIPALTAPILQGRAQIVIGARPIGEIEHFSKVKKLLQKIGSNIVRAISKAKIPDAPSGFRAFSREAALRLNVFNDYTYTLETIIQAGQKNMAVASVPVRVNGYVRPSRLIKSMPSYIVRSMLTMVRIFVVYRPFRFFCTIGCLLFAFGFMTGLRFLYYYFTGHGDGHIQSLILASIFLGIGFQTMLVAFVADLLSVNRKILEDIQYFIRRFKNFPRSRKDGRAAGFPDRISTLGKNKII